MYEAHERAVLAEELADAFLAARWTPVALAVRPNVLRSEYDQLKAILHNAALHGPESQNRAGVADFQAHLRGRISWVASLNPSRGQKLRRRFAEIRWDDG